MKSWFTSTSNQPTLLPQTAQSKYFQGSDCFSFEMHETTIEDSKYTYDETDGNEISSFLYQSINQSAVEAAAIRNVNSDKRSNCESKIVDYK